MAKTTRLSLKIEVARMTCEILLARLIIESSASPSASAVQHLADLMDARRPLENIRGRIGEDRACALFDYLIKTGNTPAGLHPGVIGLHREYHLPCGRVDRLLEHDDGSFTVVEIKPGGSRRDQSHGLGQSIMYASSMRASRGDGPEGGRRNAPPLGSSHEHRAAARARS